MLNGVDVFVSNMTLKICFLAIFLNQNPETEKNPFLKAAFLFFIALGEGG